MRPGGRPLSTHGRRRSEKPNLSEYCGGDVPEGYERETLLKHIHAHEGDKMLVGVEAFIAMWLRLPKFKYLAYAINWPIMRGMTGLIYNLIIAPYLYRRYRRETCTIN